MNVGLPGTGIGGLFYLVTALCMPLLELARTLWRGQLDVHRWRVAWLQASLAGAILGGMYATAWTIHRLAPVSVAKSLHTTTQQVVHHFGVTPTLVTVSTLLGLVLLTELLRLVQLVRRRVDSL